MQDKPIICISGNTTLSILLAGIYGIFSRIAFKWPLMASTDSEGPYSF